MGGRWPGMANRDGVTRPGLFASTTQIRLKRAARGASCCVPLPAVKTLYLKALSGFMLLSLSIAACLVVSTRSSRHERLYTDKPKIGVCRRKKASSDAAPMRTGVKASPTSYSCS